MRASKSLASLRYLQCGKHLGKTITIRESNHALGVYEEHYAKYNVLKSSILLAETGVWKKVSEYDQEIPQSQTTDNPMAPRGRATQPSIDTGKTN